MTKLLKSGILLSLLLSIFFASCSNKEKVDKLLSKITSETEREETTFFYDSLGRLVEHRDIIAKREITYDDDNSISAMVHKYYSFDSNGKEYESKITFDFKYENDTIVAYVVSLDEEGQVIEGWIDRLFLDEERKKVITLNSTFDMKKGKQTFEYDENDNLIKISRTDLYQTSEEDAPDILDITFFKYDSKHNAFANALPAWFKAYSGSLFFDFYWGTGQNNIKTVYKEVENNTIDVQYKYNYDRDGYISKSTINQKVFKYYYE